MKIKILKFLLWLHENHIQEDWNDYNKLGKVIIFPAWFIRSALVWIFSPFLIPHYIFTQSEIYKAFQRFGSLTPEQMTEINKIQRQNFINKKLAKGRRSKR